MGYLVVPDNLVARFATRMTAINWMTSPITLDIVNYLLEKEIIQDHQQDLMVECDRRFSFAINELKPWLTNSQINAVSSLSHLWIKIPSDMGASDFIDQARGEGISLLGGERFVMSRQMEGHSVRVCLMGVEKFEDLKRALQILSGFLSRERAQIFMS
ncbi:MAG: hypothetical protein JKX94_11860 [Sneathiella sp.]|nr:hypothetical protein [Sneathiella sp.]